MRLEDVIATAILLSTVWIVCCATMVLIYHATRLMKFPLCRWELWAVCFMSPVMLLMLGLAGLLNGICLLAEWVWKTALPSVGAYLTEEVVRS